MILQHVLQYYRLILGSGSPRRHQLIQELGVPYDILSGQEFDETYPSGLKREQIALYLAEKKAELLSNSVGERQILITADTIVWVNGQIMNKPADRREAINMLSRLSGTKHEVITGVCLSTSTAQHAFYALTDVYFRELSPEEITFYIDTWEPYDKAGSYGIQEWIGYIGIQRIDGSFYNVMGLPMSKLYTELKAFVNH